MFYSIFYLLREGIEIHRLVTALENTKFLLSDDFGRIDFYDPKNQDHNSKLEGLKSDLAELHISIWRSNYYGTPETEYLEGPMTADFAVSSCGSKFERFHFFGWDDGCLPNFETIYEGQTISTDADSSTPTSKRTGTYNRLICVLADMAGLGTNDGSEDYEVIARHIRNKNPLSGNLEAKRTIKAILEDAYDMKAES